MAVSRNTRQRRCAACRNTAFRRRRRGGCPCCGVWFARGEKKNGPCFVFPVRPRGNLFWGHFFVWLISTWSVNRCSSLFLRSLLPLYILFGHVYHVRTYVRTVPWYLFVDFGELFAETRLKNNRTLFLTETDEKRKRKKGLCSNESICLARKKGV